MNHPHSGGSYRREEDGSLTRISFVAETDGAATPDLTPTEILTVPELPAEPPTETETQPQEETTAKKGKA